jgi:hypothetical protein
VIEDAQQATSAVIDRGGSITETLRELGPAMVAIGGRYRFLSSQLEVGAQILADSRHVPDDPVRLFMLEAKALGALRDDAPLDWMLALIQSSAMATMDEIEAGSLDSETAGRLLGETWVAALVRSR